VYQVTSRRLQKLQEEIKANAELDDRRGKNSNRPYATPSTIKDTIRVHINALPTQKSHYSRGNSQKLCLSPDFNINKLFELFMESQPNVVCSKNTCRDILNSEFNLRFVNPLSDSCCYCNKLFIQLVAAHTEGKRRDIETQSKLHYIKAGRVV
jgi:hypothetical protein